MASLVQRPVKHSGTQQRFLGNESAIPPMGTALGDHLEHNISTEFNGGGGVLMSNCGGLGLCADGTESWCDGAGPPLHRLRAQERSQRPATCREMVAHVPERRAWNFAGCSPSSADGLGVETASQAVRVMCSSSQAKRTCERGLNAPQQPEPRGTRSSFWLLSNAGGIVRVQHSAVSLNFPEALLAG